MKKPTLEELREQFKIVNAEIVASFKIKQDNLLNNAKVEAINAEIKEHKAKINLRENSVKDLLCIESVEA